MATPTFSAKLPDVTLKQLSELSELYGIGKTQVVIRAISDLHKKEFPTMKQIKVGEINDIYLYAVQDPDCNRYYPLTKGDLKFQAADAKIFYDSGIYPGIALSELPQYICDKASKQ